MANRSLFDNEEEEEKYGFLKKYGYGGGNGTKEDDKDYSFLEKYGYGSSDPSEEREPEREVREFRSTGERGESRRAGSRLRDRQGFGDRKERSTGTFESDGFGDDDGIKIVKKGEAREEEEEKSFFERVKDTIFPKKKKIARTLDEEGKVEDVKTKAKEIQNKEIERLKQGLLGLNPIAKKTRELLDIGNEGIENYLNRASEEAAISRQETGKPFIDEYNIEADKELRRLEKEFKYIPEGIRLTQDETGIEYLQQHIDELKGMIDRSEISSLSSRRKVVQREMEWANDYYEQNGEYPSGFDKEKSIETIHEIDAMIADPTYGGAKRTVMLAQAVPTHAAASATGALVGTVGGAASTVGWIMQDNEEFRDNAYAAANFMKDLSVEIQPGEGDVVEVIGSAVGSSVPFFLGGGLAQAGAGLLGVSGGGIALAGAMGSGVLESSMLGGEVYQENIEKGMSSKEANQKAAGVFGANFFISSLANRIGFYGEHGNVIKRLGASATSEMTEEGLQTVTTNIATGKEWSEGVSEAMIGGGIGGFAMSILLPGSEVSQGVNPKTGEVEVQVKFTKEAEEKAKEVLEKGGELTPEMKKEGKENVKAFEKEVARVEEEISVSKEELTETLGKEAQPRVTEIKKKVKGEIRGEVKAEVVPTKGKLVEEAKKYESADDFVAGFKETMKGFDQFTGEGTTEQLALDKELEEFGKRSEIQELKEVATEDDILGEYYDRVIAQGEVAGATTPAVTPEVQEVAKKITKEQRATEKSIKRRGTDIADITLEGMVAQVEQAEAGSRQFRGSGADQEVTGVSSTFPQWSRDLLGEKNTKKKLERVVQNIQDGNVKEDSVEEMFLDELQKQARSRFGEELEAMAEVGEVGRLEPSSVVLGEIPTPKATKRKITPEKALKAEAKAITGHKGKKRLAKKAELLQQRLEEFDIDKTQTEFASVNKKQDAVNAVAFVDQDYKRAIRVTKGLESPPPGVSRTAIQLAAMAEARDRGDSDLVGKTTVAYMQRGTRLAQELSLRESFDSNSDVFWMQKLYKGRLEQVAKKSGWVYEKGSKKKFTKQTTVQEAMNTQIEVAKGKIDKNVVNKLQSAQSLIDTLTC